MLAVVPGAVLVSAARQAHELVLAAVALAVTVLARAALGIAAGLAKRAEDAVARHGRPLVLTAALAWPAADRAHCVGEAAQGARLASRGAGLIGSRSGRAWRRLQGAGAAKVARTACTALAHGAQPGLVAHAPRRQQNRRRTPLWTVGASLATDRRDGHRWAVGAGLAHARTSRPRLLDKVEAVPKGRGHASKRVLGVIEGHVCPQSGHHQPVGERVAVPIARLLVLAGIARALEGRDDPVA